jgi:xanthine dehydrogenase accessory factor
MASDAKMVIGSDGRSWGTIGGGCVEADVTGQALDAAARGQPTFVSHTLNADVAGDLGLSCGGTAEFFLEPVVGSEEMIRLYAAVAEAIDERHPAEVFTALDWSGGPCKALRVAGPSSSPSSPTIVAAGGLTDLPDTAADSAGRTAAHLDQPSQLFIEQLVRMPRVVIFGAGHVGAEIAKLAANVGFHVVVIDDREEFANPDRVPWAHRIIVDRFDKVLRDFRLDEDDYVLATTRGHSFDALVIESTAGSRARYVGMLGSRRKRAVIMRALEAAGVPLEDLRRVVTPIGVDIGADTPAEIAVSVVGELIKVRRLGEA